MTRFVQHLFGKKKKTELAAKVETEAKEPKAGDLRSRKATATKYSVAKARAKRKAQRKARRACRLAVA